MSVATPINKFISNHAKMLQKEIKDMKIDRRKKKKKTQKPMTINRSVWRHQIKVCLGCLIIIYKDFKQWMCLNTCICKPQ